MEVIKIYDSKFQDLLKLEPRIVEYDSTPSNDNSNLPQNQENDSGDTGETPKEAESGTSLSCSYCKVQFEDLELQRSHYKMDWHRYNLHRHLDGRTPITEEDFEEQQDVSSISGSEDDEESMHENRTPAYLGLTSGKVYLTSSNGKVLLLHRCLLADKKYDILNLKHSIANLKNSMWCILMIGGGHFAGAIFDGPNPILHKTIHCYTVRAGQGGSQSSRDSKNASSAPKSAGASLRRYNEKAMNKQVVDILETWKEEIAKCSIIAMRAPGPFNKQVLFGGKTAPLDRNDERLRVIPFATRRATFKEVKRVHDVLSNVSVYSPPSWHRFLRKEILDVGDSMDCIPKEVKAPDTKPQNRRNKSKSRAVNRAKSRESIERPLPCPLEDESIPGDAACGAGDDEDLEYSFECMDINFTESMENFGDAVTESHTGNKRKSEKHYQQLMKQARLKEEKAIKEQENILKLTMIHIIMSNNTLNFTSLIERQPAILSLKINALGDTPLHFCTQFNKNGFVEILLNCGADVCVKNTENKTPYMMTQDKETREIFKTFARKHPDNFNYAKAQIPVVTQMSEEEMVEKRLKLKESKRAKREKSKIAKKLTIIEKEEQAERERFSQLSDREKRALAAERRILDAKGQVISRCFLCGADMTASVPFEYSSNRFCSIDCLKAHRMKNPVLLK